MPADTVVPNPQLTYVRPYPNADGVCFVIGENALTANFLDHTATLVGCPAVETDLIGAMVSAGGQRIDQFGDWVLLSVPDQPQL